MKELKDSDFQDFIGQKKPAIIDFWAPWCGPCRISSPVFEELSKEFAEKIEFAKMNIDENTGTPGRFGIFSIPTFLIFKEGEQIGEIHGAIPKAEFRQKLKDYLQ